VKKKLPTGFIYKKDEALSCGMLCLSRRKMAAILVGVVVALLLIMLLTGQLAGTEYRAGQDRSEEREPTFPFHLVKQNFFRIPSIEQRHRDGVP